MKFQTILTLKQIKYTQIYHLYHRIAVLGIFKNSLNIEIASNSDAEWGNAHLITQKQAYVQEGSGFMKAAPVRDIWKKSPVHGEQTWGMGVMWVSKDHISLSLSLYCFCCELFPYPAVVYFFCQEPLLGTSMYEGKSNIWDCRNLSDRPGA